MSELRRLRNRLQIKNTAMLSRLAMRTGYPLHDHLYGERGPLEWTFHLSRIGPFAEPLLRRYEALVPLLASEGPENDEDCLEVDHEVLAAAYGRIQLGKDVAEIKYHGAQRRAIEDVLRTGREDMSSRLMGIILDEVQERRVIEQVRTQIPEGLPEQEVVDFFTAIIGYTRHVQVTHLIKKYACMIQRRSKLYIADTQLTL